LAAGLLLSGCQKVTDEGGGGPGTDVASTFVVDYAGNAATPAKAVEGATPGGNITVVKEADFSHLDPQQIYVSDALSYGGSFIHRNLTYYIEPTKAGEPLQLVGDLATNAGTTTDNGKTWTYTLRDGIKFDDGTPITSTDVAYGIARSFGAYGVQGPQYLQNALNPARDYNPTSWPTLPPGVTTPNEKMIVFTFNEPHAEIPYLLSFPTSTPVPKAKDTNENYDRTFVASGPYKTREYVPDTRLVLEKNTNWDPNSDPIRHQFVDTVTFEFGVDADAQTNRLIAATGGDASAVMDANVSPSLITQVKGDPAVMQRTDASATPFVTYLWINTTRVTDVDVRRALNYAHNRDAYIKAVGGFDVAVPATTIMAPIVPGYKQFDIYAAAGGGNEGDVEKAKQLLTGKTVPRLKYCFANTAVNQTVHATIQSNLSRAGFQFVPNPIDPANYFDVVGRKSTDCDIASSGWGQDWPDGESTLGVLMDGSKIVDEGNNNYSYFTDAGVVADLKRLREATDRSTVAAEYGALDEKIMRDFAPVVPLRYLRNFIIYGPKVGNAPMSPLFAHFNLAGAYVRP
jgi:peptide/nickel transport system substrate-binding protein